MNPVPHAPLTDFRHTHPVGLSPERCLSTPPYGKQQPLLSAGLYQALQHG